MGIVMVGGQARHVGKTGVVTGIIAALPSLQWTAIKLTVCHHSTHDCHCDLRGRDVAISEETLRDGTTDTLRYLAAGAARAFWIRTSSHALSEAVPLVRALAAESEHLIVESSRLQPWIPPGVLIGVMSPDAADEKPHWPQTLASADAVVTDADPMPTGLAVPCFRMTKQERCSAELAAFVVKRLLSGRT